MSVGSRLASSAREVWNDTITSLMPRAEVRGSTPAAGRDREPVGAPSTASRCPSLIPSFFASGVPEYPATRSP